MRSMVRRVLYRKAVGRMPGDLYKAFEGTVMVIEEAECASRAGCGSILIANARVFDGTSRSRTSIR
jgi:hypothetical protein